MNTFFFNFNCYWFLLHNFLSGSSITCWKIHIYSVIGEGESSLLISAEVILRYTKCIYRLEMMVFNYSTVIVSGKYQYPLLYLSTLYLHLSEFFPKTVTSFLISEKSEKNITVRKRHLRGFDEFILLARLNFNSKLDDKLRKKKKLTLLKDKNDINSTVLSTTSCNWHGNLINDLGLRMVNALPFIHQLDKVVQTRFFMCQHLIGSIKHVWKIIIIYLCTVIASLVKHHSFNMMISH